MVKDLVFQRWSQIECCHGDSRTGTCSRPAEVDHTRSHTESDGENSNWMLWPPHWVLLRAASTRPQACLFSCSFSHSPEELITLLASDRIWREQTSTMFSPNTLPTYRSAPSMLLLSCLYPKALGYSCEQNRKKNILLKIHILAHT